MEDTVMDIVSVPVSMQRIGKTMFAIGDAMQRAQACMAAQDPEGASAWLRMAALASGRMATLCGDASEEVTRGSRR